MKKATGIKVTTYDVGNDFRVEVVEDKDFYEAWIYKTFCEVKMVMYGTPKWMGNRDEFIESLEPNLNKYIEEYTKKHILPELPWWERA